MSKSSTPTPPDPSSVRCRRAYFDCRHGQLHVRTAFPATGGFDEQVTLLCLHAPGASSRAFAGFLPLAAAQRSVYAPDLPGCGESDAPAPPLAPEADAATAALDLVAELRLRQIDVLGLHGGAAAGVELALARPGLVRALVLVGAASEARVALLPPAPQGPRLLRLAAEEYAAPLTAAAAARLVMRVDEFLNPPTARRSR